MQEIIKLLDEADGKLREKITGIGRCPRHTATMGSNLKLLLECRSLLQEAINKLLAQEFVS